MRRRWGLVLCCSFLVMCGIPDEDGDGFNQEEDCNDADAKTFPGAAPLDSDSLCMTDADGDGYGEMTPAPDVLAGTDCHDGDAATYPGAGTQEISPEACRTDADGDGYGAMMVSEGVAKGTDCDDNEVDANPAEVEVVGDGIDNDCFWRTPDDDRDEDGYSDSDEAHAGTDPDDSGSVIYTGGWPYQADKGSMTDPGWETTAETGAMLPHFTGVDQFGESVDLYDYAGHGVPVALDLSTHWCAPCRAVAAWLSTGEVSHVSDYVWWKDEYLIVRDLVNSGQILWVTVIYEDASHNDVGPEAAAEWDEWYPHDDIAVLADEQKLLHSWIRPTGIPNVNLLNDDMTLMDYQNRGLDGAFNKLVELYAVTE